LGEVNYDPPLIMDEYPYSMNEFTMYMNSDDKIVIEKTPVMSEATNHLWKYNEDKILKDVQDYVTGTYNSHYCGHNQDYKDTQTIDLMAAKDLAAHFCQANILKYGSRYGDKDGRNKRDLLKVIHYAMLLLHFDGHYSRKDNGLTEFR
jgi:murein L,D-transpeptidase YafK